MALCHQISLSLIKTQFLSNPPRKSPNFVKICCTKSEGANDNAKSNPPIEVEKKLSKQSSWEAKDSEGKDYLYRLGTEADNMNIAVGARAGVIDDLFIGDFLGKDSDIVFDYRQKATRSFEYLQGDYYIAPVFLDKVGKIIQLRRRPIFVQWQMKLGASNVHGWAYNIPHNNCSHGEELPCSSSQYQSSINFRWNFVTRILTGVWGGKGQGKTFQTELIFRAMGVEPVIMSAGELESERAGEPGRLIRERYRTASQVVQNQGKMSCLMINDIDAGLGIFANTQVTVNNQIVAGTLMNLSDNPTRVSTGQAWRESDTTHRIPIIVTGNDLARIYAPLIRDGRMDKFYWQPTQEDIINIVYRMYEKDGITRDEVVSIVSEFPGQALDFYGALRSRTYDRSILQWVNDAAGGPENLGNILVKKKKGGELPLFTPPKQTVEALLESGYDLRREQKLIMETKLSQEYMKNMD